MSLSKHDREDYEQGRADRDKGLFESVLDDITVNHPDSSAYYKGRAGKELDEEGPPVPQNRPFKKGG